MTCLIAARALAACSWTMPVYLNEVWAPVPATRAVALDLERKIRAVRIYCSEMEERELCVAALTNLARYRGVTCLPGQNVPVECFLRVDRAAFVERAEGTK